MLEESLTRESIILEQLLPRLRNDRFATIVVRYILTTLDAITAHHETYVGPWAWNGLFLPLVQQRSPSIHNSFRGRVGNQGSKHSLRRSVGIAMEDSAHDLEFSPHVHGVAGAKRKRSTAME